MTSFFGNTIVTMIGVSICVYVIVYLNADMIISWLWKQSLGNREYVIKKLDLMFVEVNQRTLTTAMLLGSFGLGALAFVAFWPKIFPGMVFAGILTILGWQIPRRLVDMYYASRSQKFVDQMVDGLTLMSNGVRSGLSVPQAMKLVSDRMPNPMSQEFELMLSQNALGVSLEDVLNDLARRIPSPDVQMFVTAVNILKDTGGNIAETFDTIAKTVRERIKIEKKIAAVTAQGVMQGMIITAVPFVLIGLFYYMDPSYISPLFNTPLGLIMLGVMLFLQITGGLMIRRIVKVKV